MPVNELIGHLEESEHAMRDALGGFTPEILLVLGSGLGPLAERIEDPVFIPFADVPHMKTSTATSHIGRFVAGMLGGKRVLCMQGRLHGYEGNSAQEVAYPIWLAGRLGAETLITTNAAGAINESYEVGDFCIMADHINFTGRNPVAGIEPNGISGRFFSMYEAYDSELRMLGVEVGQELGLPVHEGVYLGLLGPSFETAAEIRAFCAWGADTVAMSVCEEVIAARHIGLRVFGMSLCTNMACGVESADPSDEEVLEVAKLREGDFCRFMEAFVSRI